jgi:hypothetical protein
MACTQSFKHLRKPQLKEMRYTTNTLLHALLHTLISAPDRALRELESSLLLLPLLNLALRGTVVTVAAVRSGGGVAAAAAAAAAAARSLSQSPRSCGGGWKFGTLFFGLLPETLRWLGLKLASGTLSCSAAIELLLLLRLLKGEGGESVLAECGCRCDSHAMCSFNACSLCT